MKHKNNIDRSFIHQNPDGMAPRSTNALPEAIPGVLSTSEPIKWEYQPVLGPRCLDLSNFGAEGWELISVISQPADQAIFYFKRPKQ